MTTEFSAVKDSGKREEFSTGSRRDTREGKGRYDLMSPYVAFRDARHLENGAKKYGDRNWEKGQDLSRYWDSAVRHLFKYLEGHRDEDHLAAARWNIGCLMHTEEMIRRGRLPKELDDLPEYLPKATPGPSPIPADWRTRFRVEPHDSGWRVTDDKHWLEPNRTDGYFDSWLDFRSDYMAMFTTEEAARRALVAAPAPSEENIF